jgi:hypothetical protein
VKVVVPYPAGGSPDLFARVVARELSGIYGQPFNIDNKPGAGGNLGSDLVAKAVLIRATGPALAGFGVTGTLALPRLTVFDSTSTPIAENAGWDSSGISDQIIAASQSVGAFALTSGTADSVVLAVLPPGSYTAQVIGADGGSGVTLVEVYELP